MTIVNVNYASLDEVFGSDFNKKKKKKTKKIKQPACNYYARRYEKTSDNGESSIQSNDVVNNYAGYSVNDHSNELNVENNVYGENNRKAQEKHQVYIDDEEEMDYFDKLYKSHEFKPLESTDGYHLMDYKKADEDEEDDVKPKINRRIKTDTIGPSNMLLMDDNINKYEEDKNYLDFGLYLISGILLIFILEQFVQLGMLMKEKRAQEKLYVF